MNNLPKKATASSNQVKPMAEQVGERMLEEFLRMYKTKKEKVLLPNELEGEPDRPSRGLQKIYTEAVKEMIVDSVQVLTQGEPPVFSADAFKLRRSNQDAFSNRNLLMDMIESQLQPYVRKFEHEAQHRVRFFFINLYRFWPQIPDQPAVTKDGVSARPSTTRAPDAFGMGEKDEKRFISPSMQRHWQMAL